MEKIKSLYRYISPKFQSVHLDYKVSSRPRYGHGLPPHGRLYEIINAEREVYREILQGFLSHLAELQAIRPSGKEQNEQLPAWNNGFLPGLDIVGIYGMLARFKPRRYIEIGSGNSTRVARKAIQDHQTGTEIISIDPFPRANIDAISDKVIRQPLENLKDFDFITSALEANDILFIDNSHRCFPNSDVMLCFLELLPNLKPGVVVHIHDIYLPYDYPQFMCDRYYNEQYMLAAFLLANPGKYKTLLPNYFISEDRELSSLLSELWNHSNLAGVEKHGGSYWLQIS